MKKLFLIPLLACFSCVMAFATVHTAGTFAELQSALSAAANGDEIQLTADIAYPKNGTGLINITKSITLDGQGHKISGYGDNGGRPNVIAINNNNPSYVDVTLKNLDIYSTEYRPLETRGYITKLTLDNVNITSTGGSSNPQGLTIGGTQTSEPYAQLVIRNSQINATASGYPVLFWNPTVISLENSKFNGYCALYFKDDSYGSSVTADACDFDAPNVHSGKSNAFAVFALETTNLTFNLNNCGINADKYGDQSQNVFSLSEWTPLARRNGNITVNFSGDNSHYSTSSMFVGNTYYYAQVGGAWTLITNDNKDEFNFAGDINITFTGGTYSVDPREVRYYKTFYWEGEDLEAELGGITIPETHEVIEVTLEGVATPLYRVVKKAQEKADGTLYDLNDLVKVEVAPGDSVAEGVAAGNNPVSSFDLSTGTEMELNQETTTAGYVQVSDNGDDATIIKVGKVEDAGTPEETKVDQTLVINNGLDVQGESQVIVQAGSTIQIGEGGINTEKPSNIVIEADENGAASLIMDPAITVNQTPNLTVKMKAKQIGWISMLDDKYRFWHRFALPIQEADSWVKIPNKSTYVFGWNYAANDWEQLSALTQMEPFKGYTLTADYENLGNVEYTFTGQLAGNTNNALSFERNGFNFFGNSYTGYIDILALVDQIMGDAKIDGTVWVWNQENQSYVAVPLQALRANPDAFDPWMREVAPMQTFILKQNGSENASAELNYASAVWGNPRYNNTSAPAPSRAAADETTRMRIVVTAENGKSDFVMLTEDAKFSNEFEKGYDGEKYMNENALNMYATVEGADYTAVATDNLEGQTVTIKTVEAVNYTMSFAKVNGEAYAIRDNVTGAVIAIEEGATYEFAAQPNSLVENRFEIVPVAKVPTAIENAEVKSNVKGIYTIMGQYLGENFDILPAGIYVINGVKIVK